MQCLHEDWYQQQACVFCHYKFYVAVENHQYEGFITEKIWNTLPYGVIPIYWGATNIKEVLPDPDAVIHVSDFESLDKLTVRLGSSANYIYVMPCCPILYSPDTDTCLLYS